MLKNKYMYLSLIVIFVMSISVFYYSYFIQEWQVTNNHWVSDLPVHSHLLVKFAKAHSFPVYTVWYRLAYVFAGFSEQYSYIAYASIFLLAVSVVAKYIITYWILRANCTRPKNITLISFAMIFVMPIISYYSCTNGSLNNSICVNDFHVYLGNAAPNQWHNSTLILAMPFNLLLFYYSVKNCQSERLYPFLAMGILSVISILCKPNYALAFLPVLCITILILNIKSQQYLRALIRCSLVAVPSVLALVYQWYFTFLHNDVFEYNTKTVVAPFLVWSNYSPHIVLSLILSIAFPLLVLVFYFKKINFYLMLSWLTFLVALSMMALLAEYPGWSAGNYFWGAIAANYILFLSTVSFLLNQPIDWQSKIAYLVFGVHFLSGCFLLGSFFIQQTSLLL